MPRGLYADLDIRTAHLRVMETCPLPARRLHEFPALALDDPRLRSPGFDVLAECVVDTGTPRYPWDSGAGVYYPTGTFRTTLAGPEIREAASRGELRAIGPGYAYRMTDHMAGWAAWVRGIIESPDPDIPYSVRLAAKHWSRCVPGKWAGRTSEVVSRTPDPRPGWQIEQGFLAATGSPADFLLFSGETWTIRRDAWADDAFPAILAWIQSHTRVALGRLIDALGSSVLAANTDGVLVDVDAIPEGLMAHQPTRESMAADKMRWLRSLLPLLDERVDPFHLAIKGSSDRIQIISPQHTILGSDRTLAGIPDHALQTEPGRFQFIGWPKLRVQLREQAPAGYSTISCTSSIAHVPPAGWLLTDGSVAPVRLLSTADGGDDSGRRTEILPPPDGLAPASLQHVLLRPMVLSPDRT